MCTSPAGLVIEHDHRRAVIKCIGAVSPQVGVFGLAAAGIELAHRRFVGVQATSLPEQFGQPVGQRLQSHADAPDPLAHRGAGQWHACACRNLFDPVQRQMIEVLANGDPSQQANSGHATVDHGRRNWRRRYGFARTAGVLRADVAVYEEARRRHVNLLADVSADLDQVRTALATLARLGLMTVFDTRQFGPQRMAAPAFALPLGRCLALKLLVDGRQIHIESLVK